MGFRVKRDRGVGFKAKKVWGLRFGFKKVRVAGGLGSRNGRETLSSAAYLAVPFLTFIAVCTIRFRPVLFVRFVQERLAELLRCFKIPVGALTDATTGVAVSRVLAALGFGRWLKGSRA